MANLHEANMQEVSGRLCTTLIYKNMLEKDLGLALGMSESSIAAYTSKNRKGAGLRGHIYGICKVLHIRPDWLLFGEGQRDLPGTTTMASQAEASVDLGPGPDRLTLNGRSYIAIDAIGPLLSREVVS